MALKPYVILALGLSILPVGFGSLALQTAQAEGCDNHEKIDGSTAATAKKKIEKAGYLRVSGLKKSCDNFWHGKADKDGLAVNVVLSPKGDVLTEGD